MHIRSVSQSPHRMGLAIREHVPLMQIFKQSLITRPIECTADRHAGLAGWPEVAGR